MARIKTRTKVIVGIAFAYVMAMGDDKLHAYADKIGHAYPRLTPALGAAVFVIGLLHNPLVQECIEGDKTDGSSSQVEPAPGSQNQP